MTTDQSAASLLGLCEHFALLTRFEGEGHKCSQVDEEKYKLIFFITKIVVFLMYREICTYICDHQTVHRAYWHLCCVKNEAILTEITCCRGVAISVGPRGIFQSIVVK